MKFGASKNTRVSIDRKLGKPTVIQLRHPILIIVIRTGWSVPGWTLPWSAIKVEPWSRAARPLIRPRNRSWCCVETKTVEESARSLGSRATRKKAEALRRKGASKEWPSSSSGSRFHHRLVKSHRSGAVASVTRWKCGKRTAAAFKGSPGAVSPCWTRSCTSLVSSVSRGISTRAPGTLGLGTARFTGALLLGSDVIDSWYLYRIDSADKLEDTARRIADLHELWSRVHCD